MNDVIIKQSCDVSATPNPSFREPLGLVHQIIYPDNFDAYVPVHSVSLCARERVMCLRACARVCTCVCELRCGCVCVCVRTSLNGEPTELISHTAPLRNSGLLPSAASVPLLGYAGFIHYKRIHIHLCQLLMTTLLASCRG